MGSRKNSRLIIQAGVWGSSRDFLLFGVRLQQLDHILVPVFPGVINGSEGFIAIADVLLRCSTLQ